MTPAGYTLRLPAHRWIAAALTMLLVVAMVAGLLSAPETAGVAHTVAMLAGLGLLAVVAIGKNRTLSWTWIALGSGAFVTGLSTDGAHYNEVFTLGVLVSTLGYLLSWAGIWLYREQRVRGGQLEFVLDAIGSLVSISIIATTIAVVGVGRFRDDSELLYTVALCTTIMITASPAILASISRTRFGGRDRWLTAAFASAMVGMLLMTLSLRRDLNLTHWGLAFAELQLPLLAVAASTRPCESGSKQLGTWWEWVPPACWTAVGVSALVWGSSGDLSQVGDKMTVAAALAIALAVARFTYTVREVGRTVLRRHRSLTDELTGLPNRHALFHDLTLLTHSKGADGKHVTLLMLGLDGFRSLNETLGHHAGDSLLWSISQRLSKALGEDGQLVRMGGDEFAAVLEHPIDPELVASRLLHSFDNVFEVESINVTVGASIGLATFPDDALDGRELARRTEVAMTDAKRRRVGIASYHSGSDWYSVAHLALADDLRVALDTSDGSLWVGFQPQLDLSSGEYFGAEALVRWEHPERGPVSPATMLPIAERSGQLTALTDWMLEQVVATLARLDTAHGAMRMALTISAATLVDVGLPHRIEEALARHGVAPERLVIEVTEDAVMSDPARCLDVLERISELGVEIAIDDFGTGQSSLSQLRSLPANELKIDRSFVRGMAHNTLDSEIIKLIVSLGHQIGMRVVAEGVETDIERQLLSKMGCDVVQGFGVGKPMPIDELCEFLLDHAAARTNTEAA